MKVTITTGERARGLLGGTTERFVKCQIQLTPEEEVVFPSSGVHNCVLTMSYLDRDEFDKNFDGIRIQDAIRSGGAEHVVGSVGQMYEKEQECLENCRQVQAHLEVLKNYDVEKTIVLDLVEELAKRD
ncbi:hypothetical protein AB2B41_11890 [Marimonas sp. MJW-29]|uniref:Uncharacterized protein n=1 Tax=Sulfitobacter sediminis TaxID=3234186 RepID=A0ABV3RNQ2_9RHOB